MIQHERIRTTITKAKELRPFVEKLVTLGKKDSLHARRRALSILPQKDAVRRLFGEVSPRFSERPGGYTRILKLGPRSGDGAPMAFIEFVDFVFKGTDGAPAAPAEAKKKRKSKAEEEPEEEVEASAEPDEAEEDDDDEAEEETPKK